MSNRLAELRSLLSRTGALVSADSLRRFLPHPAGSPPSVTDRLGLEAGAVRRESLLAGRWRAWLRAAGLERAVVAASLEGNAIRILSSVNDRVVGWYEVPLPERAARGGQINDPLALGAALDEAFDQYQLPRRRVVWALPGFGSTTRLLDLPGLRGEELKQAIEEEFESVLGASLGDYYLNWQRLPGRIRQRTVFVVAVPKAVVLGALEALDVANVRPWSMDLRPLALARAVRRADAIVVNLEEGSLDVVIVDRGIPMVIRSLPLLGSSLSREAAQNRLVEETERTLGYYEDSNPDHPLDVDTPLYLSGSLATGIALAERLRTVTRHPIGRLATVGRYPPELPLADYLVTVGLALKRV